MNSKILISSLKGLAAAFVSAAALLLLFALASVKSSDPMKLLALFAYTAMYAGAFAGGFSAARLNGSDGLVCGALTGGLYAVIITTASLFIPGEGGCGILCKLGIAISLSALSAFGGLVGLKRKASPEKRRKMLFEKARMQNNAAKRQPGRKTK